MWSSQRSELLSTEFIRWLVFEGAHLARSRFWLGKINEQSRMLHWTLYRSHHSQRSAISMYKCSAIFLTDTCPSSRTEKLRWRSRHRHWHSGHRFMWLDHIGAPVCLFLSSVVVVRRLDSSAGRVLINWTRIVVSRLFADRYAAYAPQLSG